MNSLPWWRTDNYTNDDGLSPCFDSGLAGPNGVALVRTWDDGRTDPGWGSDTFMDAYNKGDFNARRILYGYNKGKHAFAVVMRSVKMLCIDIDGKNGGLEHAKQLGYLPPTMAETSRSGTGYHLFYMVDEEWSDTAGFGEIFTDVIGLVQGVDIRGTGCVYHFPQQRWNHRPVVDLPPYLQKLLTQRKQRQVNATQRVHKVLASGDQMEVLMMKDELMSDLAKPITSGKRNTTLFAIGQKMKQAEVEGWEDAIHERAVEVGLDAAEAEKLVQNITKYD